MIRKIIITLAVLFTLVFAWNNLTKEDNIEEQIKIFPSPTSIPQNFKIISFDDQRYAYGYFVADITKLKLLVNLKMGTAADLIKSNQCFAAVNGGFYDTQNNPLGLIMIKGETLSSRVQSNFLDGFLTVDSDNKLSISRDLNEEVIITGLQSGPMIIIDGIKLTMKLIEDKSARRMVAVKTTNDKLIFLTVFDPQHFVYGPDLADMPEIIDEIMGIEGYEVVDAMNLDGGSASYFFSKDLILPEYNPVGSLFCQN